MQSEVDTLRTRLAEKSDQLTAAKMKIDNLRVLKNNDVETATSQLHDTLEKMIMEHKKCSQVLEDKNNEVGVKFSFANILVIIKSLITLKFYAKYV